jgi:hypothetical protein
MTRALSELLGANGPTFRTGLAKLEQASEHANTDIRLTADIMQATQRKLRELGLDKHDTTAQELYQSLTVRIAQDDKRLFDKLREKYGDQDDIAHIVRELGEVPIPKSCFALKPAVAKRLIKREPPKKAMKQLGYRSLDSMLKHEPIAHVYVACQIAESTAWQRHLIDSYKKLKASDFEIRNMQVTSASTDRWKKMTESVVVQTKHNIFSLKELGAVVLLPLPAERPPAAAMTSMLLALHAMNEIRAASTFLKLSQVQPNFGTTVQAMVRDEHKLETGVFDRPISWQIVQRYYGRFASRFRAEIFEPHVQQDDLTWHSIEKVLGYIDPSLDFWRHTTHLSLLHNHQAVSLNILDVALNYCNQLPFEKRVLKYFRQSLWHELVIRYLKHENVEQSVVGGLQSELITETELA